GAQRDRARDQALGDIALAEQFGGKGVYREHHHEQRHPAIGEQRADQHDRQHRALRANHADGRGHDRARESRDLDQLAEHRAQQEHREIQLQEADHPVHEQAGEHRRHQRGIGQQHRAHRRHRREQDDAVAAVSDQHQEAQRAEHDQEIHVQTFGASAPGNGGQCRQHARCRPIVRRYDAAGCGACLLSAACGLPAVRLASLGGASMKRNLKTSSLSLAIALGLAAPAAAWAQDSATTTAPRSATTLDAVKVTARKREETLQDVPVAVTAFTADTIDKLNVKDIGDLDAQVPNLTIYAARGSTSTVTAYIRGVGQADPLWGVDPGVGIYLDDVYIARPQGALLDVFDVERIEVLRGPQGTLYGKNTIGGAIKYISRGLPTDTTGFGSITVGNYNQLDAKAAIGGSLGGEDSGLRGRVAVASMNRDGYGTNLLNRQDVSDKEINALRMQLGAYSHEDFDVQFAFDWIDDQSGVRGAKMLAPNNNPLVPVTGGAPMGNRYDIRSGMPNVNDTQMKGISATANWRPSEDWALKYVVAKRESDTETNIDFDTLPEKIADVKAFYSDQQVSHELQANYDSGGRGRGGVGIYAFNGDAGGQVLNNFFNISFGDTQGYVNTSAIALYADWTHDLTDRLKLDVGARYTDEDKHAVAYNIGYTDASFTVPNGAVAANFDKTV